MILFLFRSGLALKKAEVTVHGGLNLRKLPPTQDGFPGGAWVGTRSIVKCMGHSKMYGVGTVLGPGQKKFLAYEKKIAKTANFHFSLFFRWMDGWTDGDVNQLGTTKSV